MKVKIDQLRRAVERPGTDIRLYLLHGPDEAAAFDCAARLGKAMGAAAERVDLDGAALRSQPGRLADEAASLSLFGEPRWIRVTGAGEESVEALEALLAAPRAGNPVLVIAPGARATSRIVKLATAAPAAMVASCYMPNARDAERMVAELAAEQGLRLTGRVGARLVEASGGDRAVAARELEKLALYLDAAPERPQSLDDAAFDALGADLGEAAADDAVAAFTGGLPDALGTELVRLAEAGTSPITWLRAAGRRLQLLIDLQREGARGGDLEGLVKRRVPNFEEQPQVLRSLRLWSPAMLARAMERIGAAERQEKASGTAGEVLSAQTALEIARAVAARR